MGNSFSISDCFSSSFAALDLADNCIETALSYLDNNSPRAVVALQICADCLNKCAEDMSAAQDKTTELLLTPFDIKAD